MVYVRGADAGAGSIHDANLRADCLNLALLSSPGGRLPPSPLPLPEHLRQPDHASMHALPGNAQLPRGAGLAHIPDQLLDFLVMLEGTLPAAWKEDEPGRGGMTMDQADKRKLMISLSRGGEFFDSMGKRTFEF